ncbi:MAG: response regulator [Acetatifactor sp.]|nr:response regulator [Acetatifactor sp.]
MKILIADDEDYSREGLIESINWEEFGIDEIMQAVNGQEALKISKWFKPDIVLTDIRMPKMDGIDFASQLLENNAESKIIFISGYMEIEYLKSAIRLSVVDYIEKPVELAALKDALTKAVNEIREKRKSKEAEENQKDVQQQKLYSLLCGKDADSMTIEKLAKEAQFPLNTSYVCVDIQTTKDDQAQEENFDKILDILQSRQGKAVGRYNQEKKQYQLLISFQKKEQYRLMPMYQEILETFSFMKMGIGMEVDDYRNIYNSYKTAAAAVNCAFYQEEKRFFQIDEGIRQKRVIEPGLYGEFLQVLAKQPQILKEWLQALFDELYKSKYGQKEQVVTLMVSLLTALFRQYPELYSWHPQIDSEEQLQVLLFEMETLREIEEFWMEALSWIEVRTEEKSGYSRIIRGVIDYIAEHFNEVDMSVTEIAEYLHFSPAYLNVLFKQEMKITLKQYLSNYRLERAKKLLENDYDKITEIAEKCGYTNSNYFAKVFREATGMTPVEYRKKKEDI